MKCLLSPGPKNTECVESVLRGLRVVQVEKYELPEDFTLIVLDDEAIGDEARDVMEHYCWTTTIGSSALEVYLDSVKRGSPPLLSFPSHL